MPEDDFQKIPGVIETVVGYCGGEAADPTYQRIGDHTEAIRVTFNPRIVSLDEMYKTFWLGHTPSFFGRQYRSALWYHSDTQRTVAFAVRKKLIGDSPFHSAFETTDIEEAGPFYRAEEYHQRFLEKQRRGSLWSPVI
mmetsp:Transcript_4618/g.12292  ORF Transcript_4618/g.12292 Transcript_4618/m.12292 type:complete len:138 (-) Transcript_4618:315-728(-)